MQLLPDSVSSAVLLLACSVFAASVDADETRLFDSVADVLQRKCLRCHSGISPEGGITFAAPPHITNDEVDLPPERLWSRVIEVVQGVGETPPEMPPDDDPLTPSEFGTLQLWVTAGAAWPEDQRLSAPLSGDPEWWAWQPLLAVHPATSAAESNPIDALISEELQNNGLRRNDRADPRTLLRRLAVDLHGLPVDFHQVQEFAAAGNAAGWPDIVEQFLNAPEYGERYARHWLDLAHYADTHGFERDQRRDSAWRYRDYVIQAFNADKPYDRFIAEQIAGDVFWPQDSAAIVATGFLAAGPWDFVGQKETKSPQLRRAARTLDLDDMVTQVMATAVGLTVNCARCHDHKIDPISQREYFALQSIFAGVSRQEREISTQSTQEYLQERDRLHQQLTGVTAAISRLQGAGISLADLVGGGDGFGTGTFRQGLDVRTGMVQTQDSGQLGNVKLNDFRRVEHPAIDGVVIPDGGDGTIPVPITSTGLTVDSVPRTSGLAWDVIRNGPVASQHSAELGGIDFTKDGHTLLGLHANAAITFDLLPLRALLFQQTNACGNLIDRRLQLTAQVGYFGAEGTYAADVRIYLDAELIVELPQLRRASGLQDVQLTLPESARFLTLMATDGGNGYGHDQTGFGDLLLRPLQQSEPNESDQQRLLELLAEQRRLEQRLRELGTKPDFFGVVAAMEVPPLRVLQRGDPEQPAGDPVLPAPPALLKMLPATPQPPNASDGERRAALVQWLTDPQNSLFSRVIANRVWQWHFGTGLVRTPSDFGNAGAPPLQRRLLDFLAAELSRNNWSLKSLHRLILTSDTWCQSSLARNDGVSVDADNQLYWRQNVRRVEAEVIRDAVLLTSGKLNRERGGPGYEDFTYQDAYAPIYQYVTADRPELWRRTIYRYVVRTTPAEFLTALDCPDPANLTARRLTTTTPLQSLTLYNNEFMLQQARYFASRVRESAGQNSTRQTERAFELALARRPAREEQIWVEELPADERLFLLCRALLNSNEFVYMD